MRNRSAWLFVAVLALAVIAPSIVYAATGTFSSSSSTTALTASNSSSGRAINAVSNTGYTGVFTRNATSGSTPTLYGINKSNSGGAKAIYGYSSGTGTGATYGVYGRTNSAAGAGVFGLAAHLTGTNYGVYGRTTSRADDAAGVFGGATASSGATVGVWGQAGSESGTGVFGVAPFVGVDGRGFFGVLGDSGIIGDGSFGLLSFTETGLFSHIVSPAQGEFGPGLGDVAGRCTLPALSSEAECIFPNPFAEGVFPIVVLTPLEAPVNDSGAYLVYWVASPSESSFFIQTNIAAGGNPITFNYIVVGAVPQLVSGSAFDKAARR